MGQCLSWYCNWTCQLSRPPLPREHECNCVRVGPGASPEVSEDISSEEEREGEGNF